MVPFNEANVLDAIIKVPNSYFYLLGTKLEIPEFILKEIETCPVEEMKQRLVSALFNNVPKENRNWERVNGAINKIKIQEWADKERTGSMTKSVSFESRISDFSSISTGGIAIVIFRGKHNNKI